MLQINPCDNTFFLRLNTLSTAESRITDTAFGAVPQGAIRGFKLKTIESRHNLPMMDIFVKYVDGTETQADWGALNCRCINR